jgi:shikimate kinase
MNIVLIGYRGTGKTVVGEIIAVRLGMPYMSMDAEIVKMAGMSIPQIVEKYDWKTFRDMESKKAQELGGRNKIIIDTGGGIIERSENITALQANALIFWLKASVDTIVSRIQDDTERPALTDGKTFTEEIEDVLEPRIPKYKSAAQYEIDTDNLTPEQVADRIINIVSKVRNKG